MSNNITITVSLDLQKLTWGLFYVAGSPVCRTAQEGHVMDMRLKCVQLFPLTSIAVCPMYKPTHKTRCYGIPIKHADPKSFSTHGVPYKSALVYGEVITGHPMVWVCRTPKTDDTVTALMISYRELSWIEHERLSGGRDDNT